MSISNSSTNDNNVIFILFMKVNEGLIALPPTGRLTGAGASRLIAAQAHVRLAAVQKAAEVMLVGKVEGSPPSERWYPWQDSNLLPPV